MTKHGHSQRDADVTAERSFGRVFAVVFAVAGVYVLHESTPVALAMAMLTLAAALGGRSMNESGAEEKASHVSQAILQML
jgi:hypothetical protein